MSAQTKPPYVLERLLARILPERLEETALGDLAEEFADRAAEKGLTRARLWYAWQAAKSVASLIAGQVFETWIMVKTAGTITARDIKRNPIYSFITVVGQAVGMACAIVIMLFIWHELSYDRFHKNADHIYRLTDAWTSPAGQTTRRPIIRGDVAAQLAEEFPEVRQVVRICPMNDFVIAYGDKKISVNRYHADPSILDVFTFPLVRGDPQTALADPTSAVLSEEFARRLFGTEDPMGRTITLYGLNAAAEARVTGIMTDLPQGSHLRIPVLCPLQSYELMRPSGQRTHYVAWTYLLLDERAKPQDLEKKLPAFITKRLGERYVSGRTFHLQPLTSIHLDTKMALNLDRGRDPSWMIFLSLAAFFILVISCLNSAGLTMARSARRTREVGLRKAVGARKGHVIRQFLGEAMLTSFISLGFALILARLLLLFLNKTIGAAIRYNLTASPWLIPALIALMLLVGLLSGLYPAFVISSRIPAVTLKGSVAGPGGAGSFFRRGFVVVQFALSIMFIIGMLAAQRQMDFVKNQDLGFDKSNVVDIPIFKDAKFAASPAVILRELGGHPAIEDIAVSSQTPGSYGGYPVPCLAEGSAAPIAANLNILTVGERFFEFFRIPLLAGRAFSRDFKSDSESAIIVNESAVKALGLQEPLGKTVSGKELESFLGFSGPARIIGVVKDFHNGTLHEKITPAVYAFQPDEAHSIYIRLRPGQTAPGLAFLEERWKRLPTHLPLNYYLEDELQRFQYADDIRTRRLFTISAAIALGLASLGLFGVSLLTVERRKKEIGIRKVLGASPWKIIGPLSKDSFNAVVLANVIAWPLGYWVIVRWLRTFAYRAPVRIWLFLVAGGLALVIAMATVFIESLRAASANPVDTIRYE
ncbi:MAG: ABC transporter permease [Candidatus Aminicenantes bacterium]|nr:ABC transporter permease [Candidatus Aminicenantes bacterium]